ncbi:Uncharacterised protein [Raoultella terrigena]|uniref:Uncharacterized protein n=1 Tax=Raoultella terrigena TaxID=577 RepID=A0A4V6J128_RAOTE|nr:Uncharacterised protein [Raoultella terrigena]
MINRTEKAISQISEYIPRACRDMKLQEAKTRLVKKIALYIDDGCDAAVINDIFLPALNSHTREAFFSNVSFAPASLPPADEIECDICGIMNRAVARSHSTSTEI